VKKELKFKKASLSKNDAAAITNAASKFKCDIQLYHNNKKVNAKSLMGVLAISLSLRCGDELMITAEGADEAKAIAELAEFFA
jgi:phosphotransferase system HPr (HPr) family protein